MIALQFILVVTWVVVWLGLTIGAGVSAGIQATGNNKAEGAPHITLLLLIGLIAAISGLPLFLWVF